MMRSASIGTLLPPDRVCGYAVLRSPSPGTFVALADAARQVFLKPLDTDCLLHGQLHPSIKERLSRVRELALKTTANLHGVERDTRGVFLVWEYIDGQTLESHVQSVSSAQWISLMREVVLSVEALHQTGIVHGALHARNVIVDVLGRPRLTHVSPLLFHEPEVDSAAVQAMVIMLMERRNDLDQSLLALIRNSKSLRELASNLIAPEMLPADTGTSQAADRKERRRIRFLALLAAAAGALIAAAVGLIAVHR